MTDQQIDYGRKWYVMAGVAMGIFLSTIDSSIVNVALPTLVQELHAPFAIVEWVVLAYLLTLATLLLSMGRLGDMVGKKPVYVAGFIGFTAGSVLCGLAPSVHWLILFRVLQAIGGAMILALGMAIVTEAFPPAERGRALGLSGAIVSIGIVVGPTLGGLILDVASWHWIFFVNLPVGIAGTLMVLRFVPAGRPAGHQRFDLPGAITLFAALLTALLGMTVGQRLGFDDPRALILFAGSLVLMAAFIVLENRSRQPMLDLRLFRNAMFSISLVSGLMTFISLGGTMILIPFFLQGVLGYEPRQVGLLMATIPVTVGMVAPFSGALSDRVGTRPIAVVGLAVVMLGFYSLSTISTGLSTFGYVLRFVPVGLGLGLFQSPNNSAVLGAVPRQRLGVASGLLSITRIVGQTTGIAVLSAVWTGQVLAYAGSLPAEGAHAAPAPAQVAGLQDIFRLIVGLIGFALVLSVWGLIRERRIGLRVARARED